MADGPKIPLKDKPGDNNWVDKAGGLPDYIKRIAEHIKGSHPQWDDGRCIASAVNRVKKWAAGGDNVKADTKAKAAAALAEWEAKKASSHASIETEPDLALAASALAEDFDEDAYRLALAAERESRGVEQDDLDLALEDGDTEIDEGRLMLAIQQERATRGIPLAGLTEKPLDLSAQESDSLNMAINFDPRAHPRDLKGRFRKTLDQLQPGQAVEFPDGTSVTRKPTDVEGMEFRVVGKGGVHEHNDPARAANRALTESAASRHKESLGGDLKHPSVESAIRTEKIHQRRSEVTTKKLDKQADADLKDALPKDQKTVPSKGTGDNKPMRGTNKDGEPGTVPSKSGKPTNEGRGKEAPTSRTAARRQYAKDLTSEEMEPEIDKMTNEEVEELIRSQEAELPDEDIDKGEGADEETAPEIPKKDETFKVVRSKSGSGAPEGQWTQHSSGDLEIEMPDDGPTARITQDERGGRDKWSANVFPNGTSNDSEERTDFNTADEARKWVESRIESGDIKPGDGDDEDAEVSDDEVFASVTRAVDRMVDGGDESFTGAADEIREIYRGIQDPATLQETGMGWEVESILEEIAEATERSDNPDDKRLHTWASKKLDTLLSAGE